MSKGKAVAIAIVALLAIGVIGGNSGGSTGKSSQPASSGGVASGSVTAEPMETPAADYKKLVDEKAGSNYFDKSVPNDKTGKWRCFVYHSAVQPQDFAADYYHAYFEDDSEVHAIINLGLKTSARLNYSDGHVSCSVYEYVDGEEHDAARMFTGQKLGSYAVDVETGEFLQ